jgi:Mn2+/Fe2+ NRAMP family transporter
LKKNNSVLIGAAFLMATSAIGPGFLTQTTVFTQRLLENFGFVIVCSIAIDIIAQVSIWRILTISNLRAQEVGNSLLPNLGNFLALIILFGGLVFNIGNLAGAGLGLQAIFGIKIEVGATLTTIIVLVLFISKNNLSYLDIFVKVCGIIMILLLIVLVFKTNIPYQAAFKRSFLPEIVDYKAIITLVGGTVGGYITFAGAHRLIDSGIVGIKNRNEVSKSAFTGIIITGFLRYLLFLGTLGVVLATTNINKDNPTSSIFEFAYGDLGKITFGIMIWAASITSVIGATYTSISFIKTFNPKIEKNQHIISIVFVLISYCVIVGIGKPVSLLLFAGYINGFILPFGLIILLIASSFVKKTFIYKLPILLRILSWAVVFTMLIFAILS